MSKCEWIEIKAEGLPTKWKFKPCNYGSSYNFADDTAIDSSSGNILKMAHIWNFCPVCGADIRKPEPEVIIKKSGETWVALFDGVDYLYTKDDSKEPYFLTTSTKVPRVEWKPISEIEITDDIAKLRPMVVGFKSELRKLYAVTEHGRYIISGKMLGSKADSIDDIDGRLATVGDFDDINS